ncbi:MAG: T9SS type A sorting domain-containing protein [Bacteroidales bacterium]|nr:T9SS type A sorting domain-containing protein [Bacteroidales bacterium]
MKKIAFLLSGILLMYSLVYSQENCANALEITFEEYSTCGQIAITNANLTGAVPSSDLPFPECGNYSDTTNDLWYCLTVPEGVNELAFHVINAQMIYTPEIINFKPGIAVYTGSVGSLNLQDCFYEEGDIFANGEIRFRIVDGLTPGETIYLRVWDMDNNEFPFYVAASVRTEIPEHNCETPALLTSGGCNILAPKGTIDAPEECAWNSTDNTIYYYFNVTSENTQPIIIEANYVFCFENGSSTENPAETELQMAIYKWNEVDCTGVGGSDESTYFGCNNGTGTVSLSSQLDPGSYILAIDGYSTLTGNSLCTFEFSTNFTYSIISFNNTLNSKCNIFPNPTTNSFTIKSENTSTNVQIFNLNGKLVKSIYDYSGENIEITDLQSGIYFVKLTSKDNVSIGKLVVE